MGINYIFLLLLPTLNTKMAKKSQSKGKKANVLPSKKTAVAKTPAKPSHTSTETMELKDIQELIRFVSQSGVSEVELETKGVKLVIKTGLSQAISPAPTVIHAAPAPVQMVAPPLAAAPSPAPEKKSAEPATESNKNLITIKSPMIGTFYRQSGPDKPVFAQVGDEIKPGKVLCIIEAMKLFNEIESEVSGRIVKVLVDDATPVEFDQPLFMVEPA